MTITTMRTILLLSICFFALSAQSQKVVFDSTGRLMPDFPETYAEKVAHDPEFGKLRILCATIYWKSKAICKLGFLDRNKNGVLFDQKKDLISIIPPTDSVFPRIFGADICRHNDLINIQLEDKIYELDLSKIKEKIIGVKRLRSNLEHPDLYLSKKLQKNIQLTVVGADSLNYVTTLDKVLDSLDTHKPTFLFFFSARHGAGQINQLNNIGKSQQANIIILFDSDIGDIDNGNYLSLQFPGVKARVPSELTRRALSEMMRPIGKVVNAKREVLHYMISASDYEKLVNK